MSTLPIDDEALLAESVSIALSVEPEEGDAASPVAAADSAVTPT